MPRVAMPAIRGLAGDATEPEVDPNEDSREGMGEKLAATDTKASAPQVEIKKKDIVAAGEATNEFSGEVENVGGSRASDVVVVIEVTETNQGAHCLREEVAVSPSSLDPGEKGSFSVTLSNPCFYGPTAPDLRAEWD